MLGVDWIDWAVIVAYLALVTVIGLWTVKRVKSAASFFIGDRKFGKVFMILNTFGAGTHSDQAVTVASKTYQTGISGIWYEWMWLFSTPFFWLLAPLFRKMRAVTTGDYFNARYGRSVSALYALIGTLQLMMNIGIMLKSAGAMVTAVSNGQINANVAIVSMTAVFVIYSAVGGLSAAIVTNFVQGILTAVFSFLILPFAWHAVGGMAGLRAAIPDPNMFEIVAPHEITAFYIAVISLNALIGWVTQPASMGISAAGRTEMEGRVGVMCGIFIKRICTIAWALTAFCAIVFFKGEQIHPDEAFGWMARDLLRGVAPGLIGLFIASMFASIMSTCNGLMVASAGLFTENIYKPLLAVGKDDRHYIMVGRIVGSLIVAMGIGFAYCFETVVRGMELWWKVAAMMGIPFFVGLFWRRATTPAAWAGALAGFATLLFTEKISLFGVNLWNFNKVFADKLPDFMLFNGKLYMPWQMIIYLTVGFGTAIIVSLFTRPVAKEKLDKFYQCIRTPVVPNEPETEPFTLPPGLQPAPRNTLIKHPDFEIPKPSFVSIVGFLAGWVAVGALIYGFYLIMHW